MKKLFTLLLLSAALSVQSKPIAPVDEPRIPAVDDGIDQDIPAVAHDAVPIRATSRWTYERVSRAVREGSIAPDKEALINLGFTNKQAQAVLRQLESDGVIECGCDRWHIKSVK